MRPWPASLPHWVKMTRADNPHSNESTMEKRDLRPASPRRVNPLGAFSIGIGVFTAGVSIAFLGVLPEESKNNAGGIFLGLEIGMILGLYILGFAVVAVLGFAGALAAIFGMIRPPRWQAGIGVLLNVAAPVAVIVLRLGMLSGK